MGCTGLKQGICIIIVAAAAAYRAIGGGRTIRLPLSAGHGEGGAEGNGIVGTIASEGASGVIISVAIGSGARCLEELRVSARLARVGIPIGPAAAIRRISKGLAGAPAGQNVARSDTTVDLELLRAAKIEIRDAAC